MLFADGERSVTASLDAQQEKGTRVYDFLLYVCSSVFLMSQFPSSAIDLARWLLLPAVGLLSAHSLREQKLGRNPVAIGIGLLAVYSVATSFLSYYPTISFLKSVSLLLLAGVLLVVPPTLQMLHPRVGAKGHMLRIYLHFAVAVVISNTVYYFLMPASSNDLHSGTSFLAGRFRGWFMNPNGIGATYGMFFLPILGFEMSERRMGLAKLGLFLTSLLAVIQLLATQSRAGILAGTLSLLVLMFGQKKRLSRTIIVVMIIGLVVLVMFLEAPEDNLILSFIYRGGGDFSSGRIPVWIDTWNRVLERPIFGSGLGVANTHADVGGPALTTGAYTIEKGNSYLGALEELGLMGVAVLTTVLLAPILKACWNGITVVNPPTDKSHLVLIAIVAAGLVNAMFEAWLLSVGSFLGFSFWVFAALLLYKGREA
jgi:O-antigen ligase